jgi:hypothetical protein
MVPYGSRIQCIGATGTMWELCRLYGRWMVPCTICRPYGNRVHCMGGGWCHAPSAGHMGIVCTVWEVDGLWVPFGSMLEADGNIWELIAPYGGHMGAILCHMGAKMVPTVRQICELFAPYGSHMYCMGAAGTIWEPCGSPVGHMGGGWHHMGAKRTIWGPYGSQLHRTGGGWLMGAMGAMWRHMRDK